MISVFPGRTSNVYLGGGVNSTLKRASRTYASGIEDGKKARKSAAPAAVEMNHFLILPIADSSTARLKSTGRTSPAISLNEASSNSGEYRESPRDDSSCNCRKFVNRSLIAGKKSPTLFATA